MGINVMVLKCHSNQMIRVRQCFCLAALACILRPTNILIWITLAGLALYRNTWDVQKTLVREAAVCG